MESGSYGLPKTSSFLGVCTSSGPGFATLFWGNGFGVWGNGSWFKRLFPGEIWIPSLSRLSADTSRSFQRLVNNYNSVIVQLGTHFHTRPSEEARLFNFTIKNHILEHIGLDSRVLNPALVWGYPSEDFLMRVRKLVQSSCHGSPPLKTQATVMLKYSYAI